MRVAKLAAKLVAGQQQQARGGLDIVLDVDWSGDVGDLDDASMLLTLASRVATAPDAPAGCSVSLRDIVLRFSSANSSQAQQLWPEAAPLPRCRQLEVSLDGSFPRGITMGDRDQWAAADMVILEMHKRDAITEGCIPHNATRVACYTSELPAGVNPLQLCCALKHLDLRSRGGSSSSLLESWLPALTPIAAQLEVLILGKLDSRRVYLQLHKLLKKATRLFWLTMCPAHHHLLNDFEHVCCGGSMPASLQVVQLEGAKDSVTRSGMARIIQAHLPQVLVVGGEMSPERAWPFGIDD
jgi:hypothetical protein